MSGFVLWFTGLSAAGKTTVGTRVARELEERGLTVEVLDGDVIRTHLSHGLGYSREDRDLNVARIGWVASRVARAGAAVVVCAISPYEEARQRARAPLARHTEQRIEAARTRRGGMNGGGSGCVSGFVSGLAGRGGSGIRG